MTTIARNAQHRLYLGYGSGWLAGSVISGLLYEQSRPALIIVSEAVELASNPLFLLAERTRPGGARRAWPT